MVVERAPSAGSAGAAATGSLVVVVRAPPDGSFATKTDDETERLLRAFSTSLQTRFSTSCDDSFCCLLLSSAAINNRPRI